MTKQQIKASWPQIVTALVAFAALVISSGFVMTPSDYETKEHATMERKHTHERVDRLERALERMQRIMIRTGEDVQWIRGKLESR